MKRSSILLKTEILDKIQKSEKLKKAVAKELGLEIGSLRRLLYANDPRLTQAGVLLILKNELGIKHDNDLLSAIKVRKMVA